MSRNVSFVNGQSDRSALPDSMYVCVVFVMNFKFLEVREPRAKQLPNVLFELQTRNTHSPWMYDCFVFVLNFKFLEVREPRGNRFAWVGEREGQGGWGRENECVCVLGEQFGYAGRGREREREN
jgi:hypothetical protein